MDLATLSDEELEQHYLAVLTEQERRQALATIPGQVAALSARFVDGGGDPAEIIAAVGGA